MDLRDYLRIVRRNWTIVVAAPLLGLLVAGTASMLTKPTYSAETQLFVAIQSSGSVQELQQGNTFSQARVQSYVKTIKSPAVLQPAIDSLGIPTTAADLSERVTASSDPNTVLITVSVDDQSAVQAAAIAQGVADSLIKTIDSLEKPRNGGASPVSLSVIKPALAPTTPSSPNTKMNLVLGLLLGLIAGIAGSFVRDMFDNKIRGEADLRRITDAPLLGGITFDQDCAKKPLITQVPGQSPRAEAFRQMRTNLQFANVARQARSVVVTSSLPGEGKSTTAVNLAISLAQAGQTVCLVDADLRRPMVNEYLGLERNAGLTTALVGNADVDDLLQPWGSDQLYVLTSGQIPPNPSELLGSPGMKNLIERLESAFDTVILDAPPLLPVTDAAVLSQHAGGVVLVVRTQLVTHQDLSKSFASLNLVGENLMGLVLNGLPAKGPDSYGYSYQSYAAHDEPVMAETTIENQEFPELARRSKSVASNKRFADAPSHENNFSLEERPPRGFPLAHVPHEDRRN